MIEETARHAGHADIIREILDGSRGYWCLSTLGLPRRFRRHGQRHLAGGRDPKLRPADVLPVEFVLMAYPVLDLPPLPEGDEADQDGEAGSDTDPDG
jgi:hypothetical protein